MQEAQIESAMAYNPAKMFFVPFEDEEIDTGILLPVLILAQAECDEFDIELQRYKEPLQAPAAQPQDKKSDLQH